MNIWGTFGLLAYEYFKALQSQAVVSVRNEAIVDLTLAVDMWKSDWFAWVYRTTVKVAALHCCAAVRQKPHTSSVDVLLFLTGVKLGFSEQCCFFYDWRARRDPLRNQCVVSKCPGINWNIWLDVTQFLTKNIHFSSTTLEGWQQQ